MFRGVRLGVVLGVGLGIGSGHGCDSESECDAFVSERGVGPGVEVTLINDGAAPLYVQDIAETCSAGLWELLDTEGPVQWSTPCVSACEDAFEGEVLCEAGCGSRRYLRIDPGQRVVESWEGNVDVEVEPPLSCFSREDAYPHCKTQTQAPAGMYTFRAVAMPEALCTLGALDEPEPCDCQPYDEAPCSVMPDFVTGEPAVVEATLDYPSEHQVVIRFD